ncbi:Choline transport protein [Lachnellula arida]|uniref:Choline transport protein n=1 Tax=Lachnellula arida TaxID=1316785 RepID=A0A8T9BIN9_9HELO|nr:Choline transport protein [Lachnellula arida]
MSKILMSTNITTSLEPKAYHTETHGRTMNPGGYPQPQTRDESMMEKWGKKQQLKRNFGLLSIVALTTTLMITWEGLVNAFQAGLENGGPAGLIYGFLVTWVGVFSQAFVMAEMGAMIPLAGGQYNWVAILAPRKYSKFLSYMTGWTTAIAWQATSCATLYLAATMIQGLLIQNDPSYILQRWHGTLIGYAILMFSLFVNTYLATVLPKIESIVLILHIFGFFCVLIPLVYFGPHGDTSTVFRQFLNEGAWPSQGLSFFIGLTTSMIAFVGLDAAAHMAEEIEDAAVVIPKSMIASVAINGVFGFSIIIAVLFCLGDQDAALNTPTLYPIIEIFTSAVQSNAGGSAMMAVLILAMIFANVGLLATASRMLWAFAREKGLPGHEYLARVEPRTKLPLWSIGVTVVINVLLSLIEIPSSVAFNAFLSLAIAGFYSSFLISATVMLFYRVRTPPSEIPWGPFKMGRAGTPVTVFSIIYSSQGMFFSFWPPNAHVTAESMNWSSVVFVGIVACSLIFWVLHGRKVYKGPLVEVIVRQRVR